MRVKEDGAALRADDLLAFAHARRGEKRVAIRAGNIFRST